MHRLNADAVRPFFSSLRRCDFSGQVVVFASRVDRASLEQLRSWGARVEEFRFIGGHVTNRLARLWPLWKRVFASGLSHRWKRALAHRVFHLFYRRHLLYLEFLERHDVPGDRIFLSDARDVFFQRDPFGWPQSAGLHFFLEEKTNIVARCPHHIRWIRSQFGEATLRELWDMTVSCAGTIFGDRAGLQAYLRQMIAFTMWAQSLKEADGDQGLHNVLVRTALPANATIHDNRRGPVMTLGPMKMSELQLNSAEEVTNEKGEVVPVLHQYDRIPELREMLLQRI